MNDIELERLLTLPFEQYMQGCWEHVVKKAQNSSMSNPVYELILREPATIEALWAKRYWFNKVGAYNEE